MNTSHLAQLQADEDQFLFKTYGRYPISIKNGKGCRLWDYDGKEYIDLLAGIAVTALGHANAEITATMTEQAQQFTHVSNLFYQKEQIALAKRLLATGHFTKTFFCNSGAEANEAAIKLARRYQQRIKNRNAYEVITFEGAFHGRTLATVAATGQQRLQDGFSPMPEGFMQIAHSDLPLLEKSITPKTAAVLLEIIQGEGGINPASQEFVHGVARLCKENDILFMVDEVQTGLGRTGKWWAFQHFAVKPDVLTSAKALANGLPMGAMLATDQVAQSFVVGSHATTFGGGALLSAVAAKTLEIIERDNLVQHAKELGAWAIQRFTAIKDKYPEKINDVRGMGLMMGIELSGQGKEIWQELINQGFIVNLSHERILRLLPALIITKEDLELFATTLEAILHTMK